MSTVDVTDNDKNVMTCCLHQKAFFGYFNSYSKTLLTTPYLTEKLVNRSIEIFVRTFYLRKKILRSTTS